jgi:hypothetical protein
VTLAGDGRAVRLVAPPAPVQADTRGAEGDLRSRYVRYAGCVRYVDGTPGGRYMSGPFHKEIRDPKGGCRLP